jgi:hypothetical protein
MEQSMYPLILFMYYIDMYVWKMCLVLNSVNYHVIACLFTNTYILLINFFQYTINICSFLWHSAEVLPIKNRNQFTDMIL